MGDTFQAARGGATATANGGHISSRPRGRNRNRKWGTHFKPPAGAQPQPQMGDTFQAARGGATATANGGHISSRPRERNRNRNRGTHYKPPAGAQPQPQEEDDGEEEDVSEDNYGRGGGCPARGLRAWPAVLRRDIA